MLISLTTSASITSVSDQGTPHLPIILAAFSGNGEGTTSIHLSREAAETLARQLLTVCFGEKEPAR